jgi:hypothetical protein
MIEQLKQRVNCILDRKLEKEEIIKYSAISKILDDKLCFFKIPLESALSILHDLEYTADDSLKIYKELLDINNY